RYPWPGNVRELRNSVERLLLLADAAVDLDTVKLVLPNGAAPRPAMTGSLAARVDAFEKETILAELKNHAYNMAETARALALERSHLYKKCTQLGIELERLRNT